MNLDILKIDRITGEEKRISPSDFKRVVKKHHGDVGKVVRSLIKGGQWKTLTAVYKLQREVGRSHKACLPEVRQGHEGR